MTDEMRLRVLERYEKRYGEIWEDIERGLFEEEDAFFLMGPANYFFSAGGMKWAVDPMFRVPRSGVSMSLIDPDRVFLSLDFILLTHRHGDHFDPALMRRYPGINWIVPAHMEAEIPEECREHMTVVRPGDVLLRGNIKIHAFSSLHYDAGTTLGVEETGYFVDTGKQRILLPGDVREYNAEKYPKFEDATHLFVHVWLGRRNALNWPCGEYPAQQAEFALAFGAKKMYLAHLLEATRTMEDMWTYAHAGLVLDEIIARRPSAEVYIPMTGRKNLL